MNAQVSIVIGSATDLPVMEKATTFLDQMQVPFEIHILSAHRTPIEVATLAEGAQARGVQIFIAAAGMAAHLGGSIAARTTLPVISVPISATLNGLDALLSTVQMPPGIPVATVGIDAALNAAILAVQILSLHDPLLHDRLLHHRHTLRQSTLSQSSALPGGWHSIGEQK